MIVEVIEKPGPSLQREVCGFLAAGPRGACAEHDPRWLDVLRDGLAHRPFMLVARTNASTLEESGGKIVGYLPVALVASRLFGRFLVSLPYLNTAGVVTDDDGVAASLIERAVGLAEEHDVRYLELRHTDARPHAGLDAQRDEKVRMVLDLPATEGGAEALKKSLGSKLMSQVRKAEKSGLSLRWGRREALDDFYDIFAVNMRDLGTPVYPKKLFEAVVEHLGDSAEFAVVDHEGRAIAAALLIHAPASGRSLGVTVVPSASALREFNHTNANMWMYHQLLLRAIERGSGQFDFGRSSVDSGTYKFKKQWGAQPHPTVWQYHVRVGGIDAVRPDSPKYRRRIETWQKLPVWLTRLIGPTIVRGIP